MSHIPKGFHTVNPYLITEQAGLVIEFLKKTFDAVELIRMDEQGQVRHACIQIGDSMVELSDGNEQWRPMTSSLHIYVSDVDATYRRALDAGATSLTEPADMYYGERGASVRDPAGNLYHIATLIEELPIDEVERRATASGPS